MAEVDASRLAATIAVAEGLGVTFDRLDPGEPLGDDRIALPGDATVLLEPAPAGFIDPRRMLAAQLAVARRNGADLVEQHVTEIEPGPTGGWRVHTADGAAVDAEQVVIATGPHADEMTGLPRRPLNDVLAETVVLAEGVGGRAAQAGRPAVDHRR